MVPTFYEIVINITKHMCMMTGLESKTEIIKGSIDKNSPPLVLGGMNPIKVCIDSAASEL